MIYNIKLTDVEKVRVLRLYHNGPCSCALPARALFTFTTNLPLLHLIKMVYRHKLLPNFVLARATRARELRKPSILTYWRKVNSVAQGILIKKQSPLPSAAGIEWVHLSFPLAFAILLKGISTVVSKPSFT